MPSTIIGVQQAIQISPSFIQGTTMEIAGKVFIVTGGASGLGEGTARMLVANGAKVVIADMQADKGEAIAKELGADGRFRPVRREPGSRRPGRGGQGGRHGQADGPGELRRHCARRKNRGQKRRARPGAFSKTVTVNLIGSFNMIRLAADAMCKNDPEATGERGVLISTASVAAYDGQIGQAAYSASKGGIVGMTLPIARDLARNGIRNMTIAPGIFGTPMLFGMPQEVQDSLAAGVPFPSRLGTPQDYARLAKHIIENDMLNGEVIRLDGAIRLAPR
jgi:NAD(P)-dependent dehydrogenase (short-subunit alcohol dehydrogenase family)